MFILTEVKEIPLKRKPLRGDPYGYVVDALYRFLASSMDIARIEVSNGAYSNSNNLRRTFQTTIVRERQEKHVMVTIRGNDVYLIRKKREACTNS